MLDVNKKAHTGHESAIARWVYQAIGLKGVRVRTRLRGNDMHILCESTQCPEIATVVPRFIQALNTPGANAFPTNSQYPIYQIILYGRALESQRHNWVEAIYLKQLDQQTSRWQCQSQETKESVDASSRQMSTSTPEPESVASPTILPVADENQASLEQPEAIARHLSETLSLLGVSVKVIIQAATANPSRTATLTLKGGKKFNASSTQHSLKQRLWVVCNSDYSPDPSLVAQAVTQQLRELKLEGFHDARILALVSGETIPDWVLRVDMTPPEEMLKDWARWGDMQAIARLLNQALANQNIQVQAVLKQATLYLFCRNVSHIQDAQSLKGKKASSTAPDQQAIMEAIAPILESIGPQGIQAATVYGLPSLESNQPTSDSGLMNETPVWSEWLNLPACCCPTLAETTLALAQQGDEPALVFLLQRLLNPDLDWRLATGGIRLSLRRKQDLLHVMTEAPICPLQGQVASLIAKFIRQLEIPKIAGVRVYGRRAGQSSPLWSYGVDFTPRMQKAPPVEFAASDNFGSDQLASLASLEQPTESQEISTALSQTLQSFKSTLASGLCATQLFIPTAQDQESHWSFALAQESSAFDHKQKRRVAFVWGCLGLLLTFQSDWLIGQLLRLGAESTQSSIVASSEQQIQAPPGVKPIPPMSLQKGSSRRNKAATFNSSGFTRQGDTSVIVSESEDAKNPHKRVSAGSAAILAAARSQLPSFNNRLLDEKLALYKQRLLQRGGVPPEVLIVGSSRAMRGIDPTALKTGLATAGLRNVEVFNFGINGATAQVVDLMIRRILTSSQLPKLIIWADGARAFNSGRVDATYNAIASSVGYQQLNTGTFLAQHPQTPPSRSAIAALPQDSLAASENDNLLVSSSLTSGYQAVEAQLNQTLAKISSTYPQRTQLASLILSCFAQLVPVSAEDEIALESDVKGEDEEANLVHLNSEIDFDGFLPLSMRFVPAIYYKHHSRVSGDYDGDYESFQMGGQQDTALNALLHFVQDNQIQLVFVNLPLTQEYLDQVRIRHEQEFQQHMQQISLERGFIFRNLGSLWPARNELFSDPSHLNQYGAYEVSNQLIKDPLIPWPTP